MADEAKETNLDAEAADAKKFEVTDIDIFLDADYLVFHGKGCGQNTAQLKLSLAEDQRRDGLARLKASLAEMRIAFKS